MCGWYIFCKLLKFNELSFFDKRRMLNFVESDYQSISAGAYFFKVNNGSTRIMCKICSELTITTPEPRLSGTSFCLLYCC